MNVKRIFAWRWPSWELAGMMSMVKCPFYKKDDGKREILCEGICDGCNLKLTFSRKNDFLIQLRTFCMRHFERCEVYHAAMEKYQDY